MKNNPCPVPGCQRNCSPTSHYGVCAVHNDQFEGITYYLKQGQRQVGQAQRKGARPGEKKTPSGLYLP